ncbi:hypothetical protein F5883DRAFT_643530 [Diaporthe sp. PMI_573]|nr:hypothetical protein F5883DRAFT_643530 [Diaporthaceae sp. PMI_573]
MAKGEGGVDAQGREIFNEAIGLMQSEQGSQNIRANILAALYSWLLGRGGASIRYVEMAGSMLVKSAEGRFSHLKDAPHTKVLASDENKFLFLYWTCLMMEIDLLDLGLDIRRTLTSNDNLELPAPDNVLAIKDGLQAHAVARFLRYVSLYGQKIRPVGNGENVKWLDPTVLNYVKSFNPYKKPTDVHEARFLAMCWEAKVSVYRNHIDNVLVNEPQRDLKNVFKGIEAIVWSMGAFLNVPKEQNIMVNALSIAHIQLKNLLLLGECYAREDLRKFCTLVTLEDAYRETVLLLGSMPTLSIDKAILARVEEQLNFQATSRTSSISRIALRGLLVDGEPSLCFEAPTGGIDAEL